MAKVKFGVSNLHYAVKSDSGYATPVAIPGTVNITLTPAGTATAFYADNIKYFTSVSNQGYTGSIQVAMLPDKFYEDVFGVKTDTNKVSAELANVQPKQVALLFQEEADNGTPTYYALYNVTMSRPENTFDTTEEGIEVKTLTAEFESAAGDDHCTLRWTHDDTPEATIKTWYTSVYEGV